MKPLSEMIKEFPNNQFVEWLCLACLDVREVRTPDDAQEEINKIRDAVTGRFASLAQRAEAAEAKLAGVNDEAAHERNLRSKFETDCKVLQAKLADLEQQEPVAYVHPAYLQAGALGFDASVGRLAPAQIPLFTRPAPAADLAELVPDEKPKSDPGTHVSAFTHWHDGWNSCRAAILSNIEEAK